MWSGDTHSKSEEPERRDTENTSDVETARAQLPQPTKRRARGRARCTPPAQQGSDASGSTRATRATAHPRTCRMTVSVQIGRASASGRCPQPPSKSRTKDKRTDCNPLHIPDTPHCPFVGRTKSSKALFFGYIKTDLLEFCNSIMKIEHYQSNDHSIIDYIDIKSRSITLFIFKILSFFYI